MHSEGGTHLVGVFHEVIGCKQACYTSDVPRACILLDSHEHAVCFLQAAHKRACFLYAEVGWLKHLLGSTPAVHGSVFHVFTRTCTVSAASRGGASSTRHQGLRTLQSNTRA